MEADRRSILKMFGITVAAATAGVAASNVEAAVLPPSTRVHWSVVPLQPPAGMTYNWKRIFITDDVPDLENILEMVAHGWKPVPMSRHREQLLGGEGSPSYWIEDAGLVLMEKATKDIPPPVGYPVPGESTGERVYFDHWEDDVDA